jgi:hypothetical protein
MGALVSWVFGVAPAGWAIELPRLHGFVEGAGGGRVVADPQVNRPNTLMEGRVEIEGGTNVGEDTELFFRVDFLGDAAIWEDSEVLLREAHITATPLDFLDLKIGRQILTWGTGDLIFINDVFPKDFVSFFIGRDDAYLKVPNDAIKASSFTQWVNVDFVLIPRFRGDQSITGERLSFFNPFVLGITNDQPPIVRTEPSVALGNMEYAGRFFRQLGSYELALYGFWGFFPQPAGLRPMAQGQFHPKLAVWGFSLRGPSFGGISYGEFGFYDSREDRSGSDPNIPNSSLKYLLGHSRELRRNLTLGLQYNLEQMLSYGAFLRSLPPGSPKSDEFRHLLTARLTQLLLRETVELGLFIFFSPSDVDFYLRPTVSYAVTDRFKISAGGNFFGGERNSTFFGQLEDNSNIYLRLRYGF